MTSNTTGRTRTPAIESNVPTFGNSFSRAFGRFVLALFGWRFEGTIPNMSKFVAIGAPHTSNWDFPLVIACVYALGIRMSWMGKHTLFKPPFGWLFYKLGGIPINRSAAQDIVSQTVAQFEERESFLLAITPEGTRSKVRRWKSGFHRIALAAGVPILPIALDFGRKVVHFAPPFTPTDDFEADLAIIKEFYTTAVGKNPTLS